MDYPHLLDILKSIPTLSDVDEDELIIPIKKSVEKNFRGGDVIEVYGNKDSLFYIIKSGKIELSKFNDSKNSSIILYPDNVFGEMILSKEALDKRIATCLEDTELLVFNKEHFSQILYL